MTKESGKRLFEPPPSLEWSPMHMVSGYFHDEHVYEEAVSNALNKWKKRADQILEDPCYKSLKDFRAMPPKFKLAWAIVRTCNTIQKARYDGEDSSFLLYLMMSLCDSVAICERLHQAPVGGDETAGMSKDIEAALDRLDRQERGFREFNAEKKSKKREKADRARDLKSQGWKHIAIAEELGVCERTVSRYLKENK